jgi:hypothetical protein
MALPRNATRSWVVAVSPAVGSSAAGVQGRRMPTGLVRQLVVVYMHVDRQLRAWQGFPNGPCDGRIGVLGVGGLH